MRRELERGPKACARKLVTYRTDQMGGMAKAPTAILPEEPSTITIRFDAATPIRQER